MLSEALKIKISKLKYRGANIKIFVTTYGLNDTMLLDKYREFYLVNIENINFTSTEQLCHDLHITFDRSKHQETINNVVDALSYKFTDSLVILLCDEVKSWKLPDFSSLKSCPNVIWLLAINPWTVTTDFNMKIVPPTSDVLCQQLRVKYRNCFQIR